jgi:DNA mismatch repair protein MutS2
MQFDQATLKPTYKVIMDVPGASFALVIAENLGMPANILTDARKYISQDSIAFDKLLRHMQQQVHKIDMQQKEVYEQKLQLDDQLRAANALKAKYDQKLEELQLKSTKMAEQMLSDARSQADDIIERIKAKVQRADEKSLFDARALRGKLDKIDYRTQDNTPKVPTLEKCQPKGTKFL